MKLKQLSQKQPQKSIVCHRIRRLKGLLFALILLLAYGVAQLTHPDAGSQENESGKNQYKNRTMMQMFEREITKTGFFEFKENTTDIEFFKEIQKMVNEASGLK